MLDSFIDRYCRWLDYTIALALAVMVVLVFGNVVLRYAFNSGISVSEELSRWLFVWLTFLGAIVALKEHGHLGTDMLIGRLNKTGKRICLFLAYVLMLFACWLLFKGAYDQVIINLGSTSAVMEVSMSWFYASGMVFAVFGGLIIVRDFLRLLSGKIKDDDLMMIKESEETAITYEQFEKSMKDAK